MEENAITRSSMKVFRVADTVASLQALGNGIDATFAIRLLV
jgi:hypothetical protein